MRAPYVSRQNRLLAVTALLAAVSGVALWQAPKTVPESGYGAPVLLGYLEDTSVDESSGLVASRRNPGRFWTHNDKQRPLLYCIQRDGRTCGVWRFTGANAYDWEDIAVGPGPRPGEPYLYLGDIGGANTLRSELTVYRVLEPTVLPTHYRSKRERPLPTARAEIIRLQYLDGAHDAETLLVHPENGDLYVVTKERFGGVVYKAEAPLKTSGTTVLTRVAIIRSEPITGGDIAPDGRRLALATKLRAYELRLPDLPTLGFDAIWRTPLVPVALAFRKRGEAIAYRLDGHALLTTSEGLPTPLHEVRSIAGP